MFFLLSGFSLSVTNIYMSSNGNDSNDGTAEKPFLSFQRVLQKVKEYRQDANIKDIDVLLNPGFYTLNSTIMIYPSHTNGKGNGKLTFKPINKESKVTISGGTQITGWQQDGKYWKTKFTVPLPGDAFNSMWVNEKRATRARFPNKWEQQVLQDVIDVGQVEGKQGIYERRYYLSKEIIDLFSRIPEKDFKRVQMVIFSLWDTAREVFYSLNKEEKYVTVHAFKQSEVNYKVGGDGVYFENAKVFLDSPGEWFHDSDGWLYYYPREGENIETAQIYTSFFDEFFYFQGSENNYVKDISFENLKFLYAAKATPEYGFGPSYGGACYIGSIFHTYFAKGLNFQECEIACTSTTAFRFFMGSSFINVVKCYIHDIGVTAVRIGSYQSFTDERKASHIRVENCIITNGCQWIEASVAIDIDCSSDNEIIHNEISNYINSGINSGGTWSYDKSSLYNNTIKYNHVHHIAMSYISDLAGIFTNSAQPGTVIANNVVHDVYALKVAGFGIYTDAYSRDVVIENNLVYNTRAGGFHQDFGKENFIRNNIFAFGELANIYSTIPEDHLQFTIEKNIIVYNDTSLFGGNGFTWGTYKIDKNIYYNYGKGATIFPSFPDFSLKGWKEKGRDVNSQIGVDPLFVDPANRDFHFKDKKVANLVGFKEFDFDQAGVYGDEAWKQLARSIEPMRRSTFNLEPDPINYKDNFESDKNRMRWICTKVLEPGREPIVITTEKAHSGKRSLKITDSHLNKQQIKPQILWRPTNYRNGNFTCSFWLNVPWFPNKNYNSIFLNLYPKVGKFVRPIHIYNNFVHTPTQKIHYESGEWMFVEFLMGVGDCYNGNWSVRIKTQKEEIYESLNLNSNFTSGISEIQFISDTTHDFSWYIDDIKILIGPDNDDDDFYLEHVVDEDLERRKTVAAIIIPIVIIILGGIASYFIIRNNCLNKEEEKREENVEFSNIVV